MGRLIVSGLGMSRGGQRVLEDVGFEVDEGAFCVIIGPSGCGKTTLLRLIAGLESPDGGSLVLDGRDITALPPQARGVGMVFQGFALYPHMTARQNLAYGLRIAGRSRPEIAERIRRAAELLRLDGLLDRRPDQLSGGQQQRVAIGRAIVREPRLLLFDEPFSNLDTRLREEMRGELRRVHAATGATSVFVTHDHVDAMTLADRLVMLNAGRVEQVGPPREVYERPRTRFAAEFLGHPPINLLCVTIDANGLVRLLGGEAVAQAPPGGPMEAWLGVRPEDVALVPPDDGGLTATVETVEDLGASGLVRLTLGRERVSALVGRDRPARGAVAGVRLRLDNTSLFDVAGLRVASPLSELPATSKNDAAPIVKPCGLCLG